MLGERHQPLIAGIAIIVMIIIASFAAISGRQLLAGVKSAEGINAYQATKGNIHDTNANNAISSLGDKNRDEYDKLNGPRSDGTEFWPAAFGIRLKITDSIIALFTVVLALATWALWDATRNLVRRAEMTSERQ